MFHQFLFLLFGLFSFHEDVTLGGIVFDVNGAAVAEAQVILEHPIDQAKWEATTKEDGSFQFEHLQLSTYRLTIRKEGFFEAQTEVRLESSKIIEFTLAPVEMLRTEVDVVARPDPIDAESVAVQQNVNEAVIQSIPYTGRRNFLSAIALMPGVLRDSMGQMHIHGSRSDQIRYQLDGMNLTDPANGNLSANIPLDAIESVDLDLTGYSAELGKGSGGVVRVNSQFAGDQYRWDLTDFIPGVDFKRKAIVEFSPRFLASGPLAANKLWFMYSASPRYVRSYNDDLAEGENRQGQTISDQLLKLQWNLRESHVLTFNVLHNYEFFSNVGLGTLRPLETTTTFRRNSSSVAVSDRNAIGSALLETMFQWSRRNDSELARGTNPLDVMPNSWRGNFFMDRWGRSERFHAGQTIAWQRGLRGMTHRIKIGGGFDHVVSDLTLDRRPFELLSSTGQLQAQVAFDGAQTAEIRNQEYGLFFQDRVIFNPSFQVELGFRFDRERAAGRNNFGPRAAFSLLPFGTDQSKISGGVGLFHDSIPLLNLQLPRLQRRLTTYFDDAGNPSSLLAATETRIHPSIRNPSGLHWNLAWEHEWAPRWVSRINVLEKRGRDQMRLSAIPGDDGFDVEFNNSGSSYYRAVELALDRPIRTDLRFTASYIYSESVARPSLSLEFPDPSVEEIDEAPTEWNSPHRFVSWGYFPFFLGLNASYSIEARSGFPYSLTDRFNQIVGEYNEHEFPMHFVTNFSVERELPMLFGKRIAFRVGVTNLFNRFNPRFVDSNIDSPYFGRFSDTSNRHFVGRVRILKK